MKAFHLILSIVLLIIGCGIIWDKLSNSNTTSRSWIPMSGWAKQTYDNGQVKVMAEFTDGSVTRLKQWQENGIPMWDIGYTKGKVSQSDVPLESCWDSNFSLHNGLFTSWHENGQKEEEVNYKEGKEDGLFTSWHENGQKWSEENYKDGKEDGLQLWWYENGQKDGEEKWKDGKRMSAETWKPNGEKCPETNLKEGNGRVVWYYESGQKSGRVYVQDGKLDGLETNWYENGQKQYEINYKDGKEEGLTIYYNEDGTEDYRENYKDGLPVNP
ncbi:MAG: toxin-antitoxin system YwqK family antitoxin [Opitutales bacterium]